MRQRIHYDKHRRVKRRYSTSIDGRKWTFGQILIARKKAAEFIDLFKGEQHELRK